MFEGLKKWFLVAADLYMRLDTLVKCIKTTNPLPDIDTIPDFSFFKLDAIKVRSENSSDNHYLYIRHFLFWEKLLI